MDKAVKMELVTSNLPPWERKAEVQESLFFTLANHRQEVNYLWLSKTKRKAKIGKWK